MAKLKNIIQTAESIFERNFNQGMAGVRQGQITLSTFKRSHPSLYRVIIKSINEFKEQKL